jgi:uncharacterized protein YjiS (DUF1127 family)
MSLFSSLRERSAKRRMYNDLMQLDDHLLRDVGLSRENLRAEINARQIASRGSNGRS